MYPYGLIGNCQTSALISDKGSLDWLCWPRPDSPPVFGKLLDPQGGSFNIISAAPASYHQYYEPNTNILKTKVTQEDGSIYLIMDYCPRFLQHGRMYRPNAIFRQVEKIKGTPRILVDFQPVSGWEKNPVQSIRGNSHLSFEIRGEAMRITTNLSLTYLLEKTPVIVEEPLYFALTWGFGLEDDLVKVSQEFLSQTKIYWQRWVQHCSIPSLFQKEVIRSALALKLHCYEDTGAILAAITTSLPEELGKNRNWDYRFCWLRDAYYVLSAFRNLGHYEEMEGFLKFFINIAENQQDLKPVYRLDQSVPLPEEEFSNWQGFQNSTPVRSNNQAAEHVQNDVYGEVLLALAPIFMDERFQHLRTPTHENLLKQLTLACMKQISSNDAGLWEMRTQWQEHSFTNLMCWAGINRARTIQEKGYLKGLEGLAEAQKKAEAALNLAVKEGVLRNGPKDGGLDSSLLQLPLLRFPNNDLNEKTVQAIYEKLRVSSNQEHQAFLYRYNRPDDFGTPHSAFLICSFWLVQAMAHLGHKPLALELLHQCCDNGNHLGLYSEHLDPINKIQLGNFPQAYSHVGLINAAFAVSPAWQEII